VFCSGPQEKGLSFVRETKCQASSIVGKARLCICVPQGHPRQVGPTMANTGWGCSGAILQPLHCAAADKDNARAAVPLSSQRVEAVVNPARQETF
jgi:hypothetical protein